MPYESYISSAICKRPTKEDNLAGTTQVALYNPGEIASQVEMTVYFEDRPPHAFELLEVPAERNRLLHMPEMDPAVFEDCGFWGARFLSTTPLVVNVIDGLCRYHENDDYQGGATSFLGVGIHRQWYWANGLWLEWNRKLNGDLSKAPWPFNEMEYYYFLNPGLRDAKIGMRLEFQRDFEPMTFHIVAPGGRVHVWNNLNKVPFNVPYAVRIASSEPITTSSVRYIYGLTGMEEWGLHPHMTRPAEPWPVSE